MGNRVLYVPSNLDDFFHDLWGIRLSAIGGVDFVREIMSLVRAQVDFNRARAYGTLFSEARARLKSPAPVPNSPFLDQNRPPYCRACVGSGDEPG